MNSSTSLCSMPKYRVVIIGPAGSGKTSLIRRFMDDSFTLRYTPTIDDVYSSVVQRTDGSCLQIELIDTCGSQCFPAMLELRIKSADALVIVMSLTEGNLDRCHIQNMFRHVLQLKRKANHRLFLVASKSDLIENPDKSEELIQKISKHLMEVNEKRSMETFVTSSKTGKNVLHLFNSLLEIVFQDQAAISPSPGRDLEDVAINSMGKTASEESFVNRRDSDTSKFFNSIKKRRQSLGITELRNKEGKNNPKGIHKKWSLLPDIEYRQRKERSQSIDTRYLAAKDSKCQLGLDSSSAQEASSPTSNSNFNLDAIHLSNGCRSNVSTPSRMNGNRKKSGYFQIEEQAALQITQEIGKKLSSCNENNFISVSRLNTCSEFVQQNRGRSNSLFLREKSLVVQTETCPSDHSNCIIM